MSQAEDSEPANRVEKIRGHLRDDKSNLAQESVGAAQPPSDLTLANITCDQVRDVNIMVDYAIRRGLDVPPDVLQDIAQAKKQLIEGQVSAEAGVRFVAASAKLARVISPATIKSINFSGAQNPTQPNTPRKMARRYNALGIAVFVILLALQLYWTILHGYLEDIKKTSGGIKPYQTLLVIGWEEIGNNPTGVDVEKWMASKIAQFQKKIVFSETTSIADTVTKGSVSRSPNQIDIGSLDFLQFLKLKNSLLNDSGKLNFLLLDLNESDDESEGYFQGLDSATWNIVKAEYVLQITSRFFLPVMYGFMGAAVFLIRKIYQEYNRESLSESSTVDFRLRFFLGGVAGLAIAWFLAPSSEPVAGAVSTSSGTLANLSPLVLSFVAGYAFELLFSLIDRVVSSFTDSGVKQP